LRRRFALSLRLDWYYDNNVVIFVFRRHEVNEFHFFTRH
jgi:hypothetical protein